MSNPCFELWLWLHLRPNRPFTDRHDCQRSLEREWPAFSKNDYPAAELMPLTRSACERAEGITGITADWLRAQGTEVFRLVRKLAI